MVQAVIIVGRRLRPARPGRGSSDDRANRCAHARRPPPRSTSVPPGGDGSWSSVIRRSAPGWCSPSWSRRHRRVRQRFAELPTTSPTSLRSSSFLRDRSRIGMTFVIITGGIDLSVGSIFALGGVLAAYGVAVGLGRRARRCRSSSCGAIGARPRPADRAGGDGPVHRHAGRAARRPRPGVRGHRRGQHHLPDRRRAVVRAPRPGAGLGIRCAGLDRSSCCSRPARCCSTGPGSARPCTRSAAPRTPRP